MRACIDSFALHSSSHLEYFQQKSGLGKELGRVRYDVRFIGMWPFRCKEYDGLIDYLGRYVGNTEFHMTVTSTPNTLKIVNQLETILHVSFWPFAN